MTKSGIFKISAGLLLLISSCTSTSKESPKFRGRISFDSIIGIKYYEVKRRFATGLSFNEMGFQQEPSWIIQFKDPDTILAYSPQKKRMQSFYLHYDHGNVYNFAKEWIKIKKIAKDSLVFQRLHLKGREISKDLRSDVNMTWYAEDYIKNTLKTTAAELQKPSRADTLYIQQLADEAARNRGNPNKAFAARHPVDFVPLNDMISVKKFSTVDKLSGKTESYDYLYPHYRIDLTKAYADFGYEFSVIVDEKGKMYLNNFNANFPENYEPRKKTLQAIIDVYLKNLLKTIPGETLGIQHASEIFLVVTGRKNNS